MAKCHRPLCGSLSLLSGETPLTLACQLGLLEVVCYLVKRCQANVNKTATIFSLVHVTNCTWASPPHAAFASENQALIRFLVREHAVDVNFLSEESIAGDQNIRVDMRGNTPLHFAVSYLAGEQRKNVIRFLVEKGADKHIQNKSLQLAWNMTYIIRIPILLEFNRCIRKGPVKRGLYLLLTPSFLTFTSSNT